MGRPTISHSAQQVLDEETRRGDVIANRFRFGLVGMLLAVSVFAAGGNPRFILINAGINAVYLIGVILQAVRLKRRPEAQPSALTYGVLALEFLVFASVPIVYQVTESPGNFAYTMKNPFLFFWILPVLISAVQFRLRLMTTAGITSVVIVAAIFVYGLGFAQVRTTREPTEHLLGAAVSAQVVLSPIAVVFLAIIALVRFSIIRTTNMAARIGTLQAERTSLSRYFSPAVVDEITRDPDTVSRGARQPVTILFMDIRDFTQTAERMDPERLTHLLSAFRQQMTGLIFEHHGTVDKFIGDAIMATFGTPHPSQDPPTDTRNAVAAARAMLAALRDFNREHELKDKAWRVGVAVHAGVVFAGTVGHSSSLEYTVIGNAVNVASRIEGLCRQYRAQLLVSGEVVAALPPGDHGESLGSVEVRGRSEPLGLYRLA